MPLTQNSSKLSTESTSSGGSNEVRELQENAHARDPSASNSTVSVSPTDEYAELNAAVWTAATLRAIIRMALSSRLES